MEEHRLIKKKIEEGDGLPDMASQQQCVDALASVGFQVRESIIVPQQHEYLMKCFRYCNYCWLEHFDLICYDQIIEARDMALDERFGGDPWWLPLHPSYNPLSFRFQLSPVGMFITRNLLWILELFWCVACGAPQRLFISLHDIII